MAAVSQVPPAGGDSGREGRRDGPAPRSRPEGVGDAATLLSWMVAATIDRRLVRDIVALPNSDANGAGMALEGVRRLPGN